MSVLLGTSFKIAVVIVIIVISLYLISSLFGKSDNNKRGNSSGGFLFVFIYGALVLFGASLVLFGYDTGFQGAVFGGACLMAVGFLLTMTRIVRRR